MSGLRMLTRASDGSVVLAGYHPRKSRTWHWSVSIKRNVSFAGKFMSRCDVRTGQWHDYYWLPFGWTLIISRQDYHKERAK